MRLGLREVRNELHVRAGVVVVLSVLRPLDADDGGVMEPIVTLSVVVLSGSMVYFAGFAVYLAYLLLTGEL